MAGWRSKIVNSISNAMPQPVVDFLYRHRYNPVLRLGRQAAARALGDPTPGVPIRKGPLAGYRFAFSDSIAMWTGGHEPEVQRAIMDTVKPGWSAVDIGGHVGYHVLLLSKMVGPSGRVTAFEPDPNNFALLTKNIEINGVGSFVEARNKAMSDEPGFVELQTGELSIMSNIRTDKPGETEVSTLDIEVFERDVPIPDFIIMDAQLMEVHILRGARKVLQDHSPIVIAQHEPEYVKEMMELMESLGYQSRDISIAHKIFTKTRS